MSLREKMFFSRINEWENVMIEKIRYKAKLAREQLDHLTIKNDEIKTKDVQELIKELQVKDNNNALLENDLKRLKQSIDCVKQALDKLTNQPGIELYIEPDHMIDWNHLIYIREKSVKVVFASVNKQTTNKERNDTKNRIPLNQQRISTSFLDFELPSSSGSSDDENESKEMVNNKIKVSYHYFHFFIGFNLLSHHASIIERTY